MKLIHRIDTVYNKTLANYLFLSSFIILWIYYILLYPTLSYASEIYGEQGPNYLYYAFNSPFKSNIWKDDAGYLVWFPRLLALIISVFTTPFTFVYVTNLTALAMIAFFVAFFNHQDFRSILPSDVQRFLLTLLFGMIILPMYEIFTYINFSYTACIFVAFLLFFNKEKLSSLSYIFYATFTALVCVSKFHLVLFLPIFIGAMILHFCRKEYKSAWFYLPGILAITILQVGYVLWTASLGDSIATTYTVFETGLFQIFVKACRGLLFWTTAYGTQFRFVGNGILVQLIGLILIAGFSFVLYQAWRKKEISSRIAMLFIVFNLISLSFGIISSLDIKIAPVGGGCIS